MILWSILGLTILGVGLAALKVRRILEFDSKVRSGEIQFLDGEPIYVHPDLPLPAKMIKVSTDHNGNATAREESENNGSTPQKNDDSSEARTRPRQSHQWRGTKGC